MSPELQLLIAIHHDLCHSLAAFIGVITGLMVVMVVIAYRRTS